MQVQCVYAYIWMYMYEYVCVYASVKWDALPPGPHLLMWNAYSGSLSSLESRTLL